MDLQFWMSSLKKIRKLKKRKDCDLNSLQFYVEKSKNKKMYVKWTKVERDQEFIFSSKEEDLLTTKR